MPIVIQPSGLSVGFAGTAPLLRRASLRAGEDSTDSSTTPSNFERRAGRPAPKCPETVAQQKWTGDSDQCYALLELDKVKVESPCGNSHEHRLSRILMAEARWAPVQLPFEFFWHSGLF
eukprot:s1828_g21.t1